ncbi:MAG TPA: chromate transporter, partial [Burkholderiales bacterium]
MEPGAVQVGFREALRVWLKIGCLGFGGPAGQIALMHRILVDEKKWVEESRYLHALNFCMLLPGPEAQKLATYVGWLLHGTRGGLAAGILFVLPGALVMLGVSLLYVLGQGIPAVEGALYGIKAAVLVIVVEALLRIGRRALKTRLLLGVAAGAFIGIFFLDLPFPLIVAAAGVIGFFSSRKKHAGKTPKNPEAWRQSLRAFSLGTLLWLAPVVLVVAALGTGHVLFQITAFFSKLAVVSFGGAYALLAYMAQQAVETYGWMSAPEMVDGLGLAETLPGPLIKVTQFVGFLAAWRDPAPFSPAGAAVLGSAL